MFIMSLILRRFPKKSLFLNVVKRTAHHQEKSHPEEKKFSAIYQLPQIQVCAVVNKAKIPYLMGLSFTVSGSFIGYATEACALDIPIICSTVGFASTAAIFAISQIFNRLVGFVYISQDKEQVKISYLDFWGNRKDIIHEIRDIRDLSNPSWPLNLCYKHLNISSISKPYKISTKFGDAVQTSTCNKIFNYNFDGD